MLALHFKLVQTLIFLVSLLATCLKALTFTTHKLVLMQELMQDLLLRTLVTLQKALTFTTQMHALMLVSPLPLVTMLPLHKARWQIPLHNQATWQP